MVHSRSWTIALASLVLAGPTALAATVIGEQKPGIKGRYLVVEDGAALPSYRGALVILEPAEILADKDQPVDNEAVRAASDQLLRETLQATALFGSIAATAPLQLPEQQPILRITTKLTLQHGSQAMRFWVGAGAGKSKLHIRIDIYDARSGQALAYFNGYGAGGGEWSLSGGGVQHMALDDLEENYDHLAEYLQQAF